MRIRFGIALDLGSGNAPLLERLDQVMPLVERAEARGFTSLGIGESYPIGAEDPGGFHLSSPLLLVAALSSRTGMRLGTGVSLVQAWHPLRLAYDSAVADQLTGGRLFLGVGLGPADLRARFDSPDVPRGVLLEDTIGYLRAMWQGRSTYTGPVFTATEGIWPRPVQANGPPLLIGGGVAASAERAARLGDGYVASSGYHIQRIAGLAAAYRSALEATGSAAGSGTVVANRITIVGTDEPRLQALIDRHATPLLAAYARFGTLGEEPLNRLRTGDVALLGRVDEVVRQVRRYAEAGVTDIQFRVSTAGIPVADSLRTIDLLAEEVLPRVDPE